MNIVLFTDVIADIEIVRIRTAYKRRHLRLTGGKRCVGNSLLALMQVTRHLLETVVLVLRRCLADMYLGSLAILAHTSIPLGALDRSRVVAGGAGLLELACHDRGDFLISSWTCNFSLPSIIIPQAYGI